MPLLKTEVYPLKSVGVIGVRVENKISRIDCITNRVDNPTKLDEWVLFQFKHLLLVRNHNKAFSQLRVLEIADVGPNETCGPSGPPLVGPGWLNLHRHTASGHEGVRVRITKPLLYSTREAVRLLFVPRSPLHVFEYFSRKAKISNFVVRGNLEVVRIAVVKSAWFPY